MDDVTDLVKQLQPLVSSFKGHNSGSMGLNSFNWSFDFDADCATTDRVSSAASIPYYISTLLYCFNDRDEILLQERAQEPNLGQWSPCGGKLMVETGESPYACACREAWEEIGLTLRPADLHLTGLVSEHGQNAHWLMFLFEVKPRLISLPAAHREGRFAFFPAGALPDLALPKTDREQLWPLFWRHRGGFFAAHCFVHADGQHDWVLEETSLGSLNG